VLETSSNRPGHDNRDVRSDIRQLFAAIASCPCPEGEGEPLLGGHIRREERLLTRARVRVDRVGAVDYLSEGFFRMLSPLPSST
jgi:hypothetical protein